MIFSSDLIYNKQLIFYHKGLKSGLWDEVQYGIAVVRRSFNTVFL